MVLPRRWCIEVSRVPPIELAADMTLAELSRRGRYRYDADREASWEGNGKAE